MTSVTLDPPAGRDWSSTLFLPRTPFPLRSDPSVTEPALLARWDRVGLLARAREAGRGLPRHVVHDGPPYANGEPHFGHAMNKVLKDVLVRANRMSGVASDLVPGWDCHGLPVEWAVEQAYRARGVGKAEVPVVEFRAACREHAARWTEVQATSFRRLGVLADWEGRYSTMDHRSEARVAGEFLRMVRTGHLYRGTRPVLWSVAEGTALADAEVEYRTVDAPAVTVAFWVMEGPLTGVQVPVWTTTPWTLPANRAVAYGPDVAYGLYDMDGVRRLVADPVASDLARATGATTWSRVRDVGHDELAWAVLAHPLAGHVEGYGRPVPLFPASHVDDRTGTGFVHTAPSHGREDHDAWTRAAPNLAARGYDTDVPDTMDAAGRLTSACPGFEGRSVMTLDGRPGDASAAVTEASAAAGTLLAREVVRHEHPCSWRSRTPLVHRSTPQWFVAMDRESGACDGRTLRDAAMSETQAVRWLPDRSRSRMEGMLAGRPDWVVSRQRSWGVPLPLFVDRATGEPLRDDAVDARVVRAFEEEGADAWFAPGAAARFLGPGRDPADWEKVDDVLDVWFDSGATQAFVLDDPVRFTTVSGLTRARDGGVDKVVYVEGSDQHRGWFQSSLLVGCATRGRAPYDVVFTHGFVLDGMRRKMSKSRGNGVSPADVVASLGADVLRMWASSVDHANDVSVSEVALKGAGEALRKWRYTFRWLLGVLAHRPADAPPVDPGTAPELERALLHRLAETAREVERGYGSFDTRRVVSALTRLVSVDLSAGYAEARKDVLYCDPASSPTRAAALAVLEETFTRLVAWMAPLVPFLAEEAWLARRPSDDGSVHLLRFPSTPAGWEDADLAVRWERTRRARGAVMAALEAGRAAGRLRAGLDASVVVHVEDAAAVDGVNPVTLRDVCVVSDLTFVAGPGPADAFRHDAAGGLSVVVAPPPGRRCARSWRWSEDVGSVPGHPSLSARDAAAVVEHDLTSASSELACV